MKRQNPDEESDSPDSQKKKKENTSEVHSSNMCDTSDTCYVTRELAKNLKNISKRIMLNILTMTDILNSVEESRLKEEFITNSTRLSQLFLKNGQNLVEDYDTNLECLITFAYKLMKGCNEEFRYLLFRYNWSMQKRHLQYIKHNETYKCTAEILKDVRQSWTALSSYINLHQYLKFLHLINSGSEQLSFILKNLNKRVLFKRISESGSKTAEVSEASVVTEAKPSYETKTDIMHHSSSFKQVRKRTYSKTKIDSGDKQRKKRTKNSVVLKRTFIKDKDDSIAEKQKKKRKKTCEKRKRICNPDVKTASNETKKKNKKKKIEDTDKFLSTETSSIRDNSSYTTRELVQNLKDTDKFLSTETSSIRDNSSYTTRELVQNLKTSSKKLTLVLLSIIETVNYLDESRFKEEFISNKNVMKALFLLNAHYLEGKSETDLRCLINFGYELLKIATLVNDRWIAVARYLPLDLYLRFLELINMEYKELNLILENLNKKLSSERICDLDSTRKEMPKEVVKVQAIKNNATKLDIMHLSLNSKQLNKKLSSERICDLDSTRKEMPKEVVKVQAIKNNASKSDIMHLSLNSKQKDDADMGAKKKTNIYPMKVPDCLMDSKPHLHQECFLHVIKMDLIQPLPMEMNPFNYPIKNPKDSEIDVGLLLSKSLSKINPFKIFSKIGNIRIDIFTDEEGVNLSEEELNLTKEFHEFISSDIFDVAMELIPAIPFYIVPVKKGGATACIDFNYMKASLSYQNHVEKTSIDTSTSQTEILSKDAVFIKTYKSNQINNNKKTFHYFVRDTEIFATDMSTIPGYGSYEEYYKAKYRIKLKNKRQKLIETFSNTVFSSHKPIYRSFNEKLVNSRTSPNGVETFKNYPEYLLPEYCYIYPIKSSVLQKLQCIPVILYRMYCLLLAEDLRRSIFGFIQAKEYQWSYFDLNKPDDNIIEILSNIGFLQHSFHNPPACDILKNNKNFISFCKISENSYGPSPANILEALTLAKANDGFDLERYEIIGDSFLKYVISFKLFLEHREFHSKQLSTIRNDTIKNEYLYEIGCEKRIPIYLIVNEFHEKTTIPTCFIKHLTTQTELKRILSLKQIADSVESLIGSCLINSGQSAAIIFMKYISLDPFPKNIKISRDMIYKWPAILTKHTELRQKTIDEFKIKNLMQRALLKILIMGQIKLSRMSYLGNAILGYLLTRYLYEDERNLKPGDITLLRNKLINNSLYASLSLKYKLEKTAKSMRIQRMKQKVADFKSSEYFRFILAKGYPSEDLEFPEDCRGIVRTLSDIFQGLAAIIYMENNCSLYAVWHEYEKMLQDALAFYLRNLQLSTNDDLEQVLKTTDAFTQIYHGRDNWHVLLLLPDGTVINTNAPQLKVAKQLAAKKALEKMKKGKDEKDVI